MTTVELFAAVETLGHLSPLDLSSVARVTGGTFAARESESFVEQTATNAPGFSEVWLKLPKAAASFPPMLSLQVADGTCTTWDDAQARYGFAAKVPPHHSAPPPTLDFWQYPQVEWASLTLAFDPASGCLRRIDLHARVTAVSGSMP